jgi:hypothetical protein
MEMIYLAEHLKLLNGKLQCKIAYAVIKLDLDCESLNSAR